MKAILRLLFLAILSFPVMLFAQSARTVKGLVTDENNTPLSGVSVMIKGTHKTTVTDGDGRFSISVSGNDSNVAVCQSDFTVTTNQGLLDQLWMVGNGCGSNLLLPFCTFWCLSVQAP